VTIEIIPDPAPEHRAAIRAGLLEFNAAHVPDTSVQPVAIAIRDEAGEIVGGLWAVVVFDWMNVELLFVPEAKRGQDLGTRLLAEAEAIARDRFCLGLWLDTFSFQARGFYEKQGFTCAGEIEDHPRGGARYFMKKRFG
jgi:GNAT superfamily N-acetyltransferase